MNPLATARQLWRLNKDGRLEIKPLRPLPALSNVEMPPVPISTTRADEAIRETAEREARIEAMRVGMGLDSGLLDGAWIGTQAAPTEL